MCLHFKEESRTKLHANAIIMIIMFSSTEKVNGTAQWNYVNLQFYIDLPEFCGVAYFLMHNYYWACKSNIRATKKWNLLRTNMHNLFGILQTSES